MARAISDDIAWDFTTDRVYWKGSGGGGADWGFYTVKELYQYLQDLADNSSGMAERNPLDFDSPTSFKVVNQTYFERSLFQHLKGAGVKTEGQAQVEEITLAAGGYVNAVAGDIGKIVTDDGTNLGPLVDYDNTNRKWWVRTASTIADSSTMAIDGGTGAGTSSGASTTTGDIQMLSFQAGGYTGAVASDIGKQVTDDATEIGMLLDYDNTARLWWVRSPRKVANGSTVGITTGTGAGTADADGAFGEDVHANLYTLGTIANGNIYLEQNSARIATEFWQGSAGGIRKLTFQSGGYTNAVTGDLGKVVTGGTTGDTGELVAYNNTTREWFVVPDAAGDAFDQSEAITISGGTGAGTTTAASVYSAGNASGETVGGASDGGSATYKHIDVLVQVQRAGTLIGAGLLRAFNRNFGDTYDHLQVDASGGDRSPVPLATQSDPSITLTDAQVADLVAVGQGGDGTTSQITATFGAYAADVDNDGSNENYKARLDCDDPDNDSIAKAYMAAQWMCSKDRSSETLNGADASLYRSADQSTFEDLKSAPFGTFAGGKMFFARGVYPINVPSADASNYEAKDNDGNAVLPPTTVTVAVTGLIGTAPYDRVMVGRSTGPGSLLLKKDELTSHATNNTSAATTFECQENIPADKPSSGTFRVVRPDGTEYEYSYSSFSGKIFTLTSGTLGVTFDGNDTCYCPYIDAQASGASISVALQYTADRDIVVRARNNAHATTPMKPAEVASSFSTSGASIPISRIKDTQAS